MTRLTTLNPDTVPPPLGPYSHAVRLDLGETALLFVSGQIAVDADGNLVAEGDMARQTELIFDNLGKILAAAGATFADVLKITTFLTDISQLPVYREVRGRYTPADPPASTTVEVSSLFRPGAVLEVEVIAAVPGQGSR